MWGLFKWHLEMRYHQYQIFFPNPLVDAISLMAEFVLAYSFASIARPTEHVPLLSIQVNVLTDKNGFCCRELISPPITSMRAERGKKRRPTSGTRREKAIGERVCACVFCLGTSFMSLVATQWVNKHPYHVCWNAAPFRLISTIYLQIDSFLHESKDIFLLRYILAPCSLGILFPLFFVAAAAAAAVAFFHLFSFGIPFFPICSLFPTFSLQMPNWYVTWLLAFSSIKSITLFRCFVYVWLQQFSHFSGSDKSDK